MYVPTRFDLPVHVAGHRAAQRPCMRFLAPALLLAILIGCGGGDGNSNSGGNGGGGEESSNSFVEASVGPGDAPVELAFDWNFDGSADRFRLEVNPDGVSGYTAVDTDRDGDTDPDDEIAGDRSSLDLVVPLLPTDFANASYQVVALDGEGDELDRSGELALSGVAVEELIGYFKALDTDAQDRFGSSVALSDDGMTMAVGAYWEESAATGIDGNAVDTCGSGVNPGNCASDSGAVYVFVRSAGSWTRQAYVKASNTGADDRFGWSLDLSGNGDVLAVSATREDGALTGITPGAPDSSATGDGAEDAGAVYLFTRSGGTWSQQAYVKASNTGTEDAFGSSVALSSSGDVLAAGARLEDGANTGITVGAPDNAQTGDGTENAGAVYLFARPFGDWIQQAYIKASNAGTGDFFGRSVALDGSGEVLAVGASGEDSIDTGVVNGTPDDGETGNVATDAGAAYVFRDSNIGGWGQRAYIKASNAESHDHFGTAVSLSGSGDLLAVGAEDEDSSTAGVIAGSPDETATENGAIMAGAVYVFTQDNFLNWSQESYVKASNTGAGDNFGSSVALSADGGTLAIGAIEEGSNATGINGAQHNEGADGSGGVYVFARPMGSWAQRYYVKASNTGEDDGFGAAVDIVDNAETLAVGASVEDGDATGIADPVDDDNDNALNAGAVYLY